MRQLSRVVLAIGYGGGALLVILLLTKGNADALAARVGYTAVGAIVLGLVAAAGARLLLQSEAASLWGWATMLIAATTFVLIMVEVWPEHDYPNENRTMAMLAISLLLGGGSLVLSGENDRGIPAIRVARGAALLALLALGVLTVLVASGVDTGARWFGVASVVFLVSFLSLPFLRLAGEERGFRG